jgi:predicted dehydrogenase
MGRTHSNAFLQAPRFFDLPYKPILKAVCARSAERVRGFAENWGYQSIETDWRTLVERKDIDLIDIASPNDTHAEIAIAAAKAGKMVLCEKPLGRTAAEAKGMVAAVKSANVPNMVWYNYRRVPAVVLLTLRPHLPLPLTVSAGLDHFPRPAARRRRSLASGRLGSRQRSHRRPARSQY